METHLRHGISSVPLKMPLQVAHTKIKISSSSPAKWWIRIDSGTDETFNYQL